MLRWLGRFSGSGVSCLPLSVLPRTLFVTVDARHTINDSPVVVANGSRRAVIETFYSTDITIFTSFPHWDGQIGWTGISFLLTGNNLKHRFGMKYKAK